MILSLYHTLWTPPPPPNYMNRLLSPMRSDFVSRELVPANDKPPRLTRPVIAQLPTRAAWSRSSPGMEGLRMGL
jgi:hypothetical protein